MNNLNQTKVSNYTTIYARVLNNMQENNICYDWLVLEFSSVTLAKSLKEAVADPWLTLTNKVRYMLACGVVNKN